MYSEEHYMQLENGGPEAYGSWARANPACLRTSEVNVGFVKMLQLCMAVVSVCQVLFMISRAPKVPWEAIYLPGTEAVTYGLAFANEGYVRLANGKVLPWARMASWVCTCPIMLGMISNMALVKYGSQPLNPLMIAASLIRIVFGISATMSFGGPVKWIFFLIATCFFLFEYVTVYCIFAMTIADFDAIGSPLSEAVAHRLRILRAVFYFSWTAFPIIWLLSSTSGCILHENVSSCLYLLADAVCKNSYGIILWSTTWGLLNGKWDRDYCHNRDINGVLMDATEAKEVPEAPQNYDIKIMGQTIASVRRSQRRPRADVETKDEYKSRELRESRRRGKTRDEGRRRYSDEDSSESDRDRRRRRRGRKQYDSDDSDRDGPETRIADTNDVAGLGSNPNIAEIMAAIRRSSADIATLRGSEDGKKNDSMC
eukprot:Tamp_14367.p1 GENE.Tamp_14367~~Tamp_14367.p1  ORF type:complete len:452 (+),score=52.49 Tamp_14367:76-1356(+)